MAQGLDGDALKAFSFKVWTYKMGEQVSLMIHLGDRLGIYRAMSGSGPLTSDEVADRLDLHERFVREWLLGQAAAGLIDHVDGAFELTDVQAALLADEDDSVHFAQGAFRGGFEPDQIEKIAESFRTGVGLSYEQQGAAAAAGLARMTAPRSRLTLTDLVLPALDGVVEKLEAGAVVCDVGCGGGVMLTTLAEAYPNTTCVGIDPSGSALDLARARTQKMRLNNVEWIEGTGEDVEPGSDYDLIVTFDCMHDMAFPDRAAAAFRNALAPDGTWLIKDIRSTGDFDKDRRNPMLALMYGFSVTSCLQSAMSEEGGRGLGTLGLHAEAAEEMTKAAGFSQFATHDLEDPNNLFYEVRI